MGNLKENKYIYVENFFNKEELDMCKQYIEKKHRTSYKFDSSNVNLDTVLYKDILMEIFLNNKKSVYEKKVNLELLNAYSFARVYTYLSDLPPHKDRVACEYSATVTISSDKPNWPLFIEGKAISIKPGDAVFYKGAELSHWREPFEGDHHIQLFLHYVDKNGKYSEFNGDPDTEESLLTPEEYEKR